EKEALLRIHQFRFTWRDVEKQGVEAINAVDESSPLAVGFPRLGTVFVEIQAVIPALRRDLGDAVLTLAQMGPEFFDVAGLWIAPGQADDGDLTPILGHHPGRGLVTRVTACQHRGWYWRRQDG